MLRIPYRKRSDRSETLAYTVMANQNVTNAKGTARRANIIPSMDLADPEHLRTYTWLEFPPGVCWTPQRMEVNGRKGRRVICVVAQDNFHYRVYDLDSVPESQDLGPEGSDELMS